MAGTIDELKAKLNDVRQQLMAALPTLALTNTITAKAIIERKIREVGFGVMYSGVKVPAWFFLHKELNSAGATFVKNKIKQDSNNTHVVKDGDGWRKVYGADDGMTWADLRKAQGLQVAFVDLGYTNKMWAGTGPQEPYFKDGVILCPLGGNSVEVINKLSWNRARYGDFMGKMLGPDEIRVLTNLTAQAVGKILSDNGFKPNL